MATHPTTPYQTTTTAAMDASQITLKTTASTGFVAGKYVVIGKEAMLLTVVDTTNHTHSVKRGMKGSAAAKHPSGAIVTMGAGDVFGLATDGVEIAGYVGDIQAKPTLPIGSRFVDPNTGYEYLLVSSAAAHDIGDVVYLTAAHVSTALAVVCKGRVGVVVETVSAASKLHWVCVVGTVYAQITTATTAGAIVTGVKGFAVGTTCDLGGFVVNGVVLQAAATTGIYTTGLTYAKVTLNNPWVSGVKSLYSV